MLTRIAAWLMIAVYGFVVAVAALIWLLHSLGLLAWMNPDHVTNMGWFLLATLLSTGLQLLDKYAQSAPPINYGGLWRGPDGKVYQFKYKDRDSDRQSSDG